jgi:hypothetical protein
VSFKVEYRITGADFEYIHVTVESETMVTLSIDLDNLNKRARELVDTYDTLIAARNGADKVATEGAVQALQALGATVVDQESRERIPGPDEAVQPAWGNRPPMVADDTGADLSTPAADDFNF